MTSAEYHINPLYSSGLFHCYMLDESICHFRGVGSILSCFFFYFLWKILFANYVASDLGLPCLPMTILCVSR